MKARDFSLFVLCLILGLFQIFSSVRFHFSGKDELEHKVEQLNKDLLKEKSQFEVTNYNFEAFRIEVARVAPGWINESGQTEKDKLHNHLVRGLASVALRGKEANTKVLLSETLLERAKKAYQTKDYERAEELLLKVIQQHPYSARVVEAYFLLSESVFRQGRDKDCLRYVSLMVEQFPEHELTGFAMLRAGQIYERQRRSEEAAEVYRTILTVFSTPDLVQQARSNLGSISL